MTDSGTALSDAWARLRDLASRPGGADIRALFGADPARATAFSARLDDLTLDFSKTAIDSEARAALFALARTAGLESFRRRLFAGEAVNLTEGRAAMHMALRSPADAGLRAALPGGIDDASGLAAAERAKMRNFVYSVHEGRIHAADGRPFEVVLNIGIGGSDLGPVMAAEALTMGAGAVLKPYFLSNVDGVALAALRRQIDPARTLVLVASKSFTTQETAVNARAVRAWFAESLGEAAIGTHFAALSTNLTATAAFGIRPEQVFGFRDWVGGRYSVWSSVGLSVALAAGWEAFAAMLEGGWEMDCHFRDAPFERNLPVLLALAGIWHVNGCRYGSQAVLAYDERLRRFPAYLQQLEMESNGKSVRLDGGAVTTETCPVIFGEPGTNAQHSFMQLIHQGTRVVPVDFILAAECEDGRADAHRILAANALAQAEALLAGKTEAEVRAEMVASGADADTIDTIAPHRVFPGNRPSVMLLFRRLDARTLGRLVALYEHKVAVQGAIWGIDSFDQWGVELGKKLAGALLPELEGAAAKPHDPSTTALIARFRELGG